jgi:tRNA (guanine-N7-)-methyltransferase
MFASMLSVGERELPVDRLPTPLPLDQLLPGGPWEVEIGFGKGRELLRRAEARPGRRFLGIEMAAEYYRRVRDRARRRSLDNLLLIRGEALYLLAVWLPHGLAEVLHVYFPDPWPKSRHQKRRLIDPESLDLLVGILAPGGVLCFATDHLEYGEAVAALLAAHPGLALERLAGGWREGPRTNYEEKFVRAGRPIVRLEARRVGAEETLHPAGRAEVLAADGSEAGE